MCQSLHAIDARSDELSKMNETESLQPDEIGVAIGIVKGEGAYIILTVRRSPWRMPLTDAAEFVSDFCVPRMHPE